MGASKWKIHENPIHMDDLDIFGLFWGHPHFRIFQETSIWGWLKVGCEVLVPQEDPEHIHTLDELTNLLFFFGAQDF